MILRIKKYKDSGLTHVFQGLEILEIEDNDFEKGGFGAIYLGVSCNGNLLTRPIAVKILREDISKTMGTITALQEKIREHEQKASSGQVSSLKNVRALHALPLFSFEAINLRDETVYGYITWYLSPKERYVPFSALFEAVPEEEDRMRKFQTLLYEDCPESLNRKGQMKLAATLVEGMYYLEHLNFIHSDINPSNLFIRLDKKEPACVIIDFDGGAVTHGEETPATIGKRTQWLSPQVAKQLLNPNQEVFININDDLWSVMLMIHQFFFPHHPMFYLAQQGYRDLEAYFEKYRWPQFDPKSPNINIEIQAKPTYAQEYIRELDSLPKEIHKLFEKTINVGWQYPNNRTTYKSWLENLKKALSISPNIKYFDASQIKIVEGNYVTLKWRVQGGEIILIQPEVGEVPIGQTEIQVQPDKTTTYELEVKAFIGSVKKTVQIEVIPAPKLNILLSETLILEGEHAIFQIMGKHIKYVNVRWQDGRYLKKKAKIGDTIVTPTLNQSQTFFFEAKGELGSTDTQNLYIEVLPPVEILAFNSNRREILIGQQITLTWITVNEKSISILGYGKRIQGESLTISPVASGPIELIANGWVPGDQASEFVQIQVYPVPLIYQFDTDRSKILEGEEITLSWEVSGARTLYLEHDHKKEAVPAKGERKLKVWQSTTYLLEVIDMLGESILQHLIVQVFPPAKVEKFEVLTPQTNHGGAIIIEWSAPLAQKVELHSSAYKVTDISSTQKCTLPAINQSEESLEVTFWLVLTDELGQESISPQTRHATVYPIPRWIRTSQKYIQVKEGQDYQLVAEAQFSRRILLIEGECVDEVEGCSKHILPRENTIYTLVAEGFDPNISITKKIEIAVIPAVVIISFRSDIPFIFPGQYVKLSWVVSGHTELMIQPGNIIVSGQEVELQVWETSTYTLIAVNPCDQVSRSLSVEILPLPQIHNMELPEIPISLLTHQVQWEEQVLNVDYSKLQIRLPTQLTFTQAMPILPILGKSFERLMNIIDVISFVPIVRRLANYHINLVELFNSVKSKW